MTIQDFLKNPPLKPFRYPSPILLTRTEPIIRITDEVIVACRIMLDKMYAWGGIGLAAPQVGLPLRLFVANPTFRKELIFINPEILGFGKRTSSAVEGCLSLPGIHATIERPHQVRFRALDLDGKAQTHTYEGTTARVVQHEYDHLVGTLIWDRVSEEERNHLMEKYVPPD